MKPLHALLVLSLSANAALGVYLVSKPKAAPKAAAAAPARTASAETPESKAAAQRAAAAEAFIAAANAGDAAAVRDQLRAMGLPEHVVRAAVHAVVYQPFSDLQKRFQSQQGDAYWRGMTGYFGFNRMTPEQQKQLREANHDVVRKMEQLLGPDPDNPLVKMYSYLPDEKAAKLRALEQDYNDLRSQQYQEQSGFQLPSDRDKIAYLEREKRKDIEALLSPEELQAYDLRQSPAAARARGMLMNFESTESEYKALVAALQASESGSGASGPFGMAGAGARDGQQIQDALRAALGDERYREYQRTQNNDYRMLEAAAKRFNLPKTTVDQVMSTRDQVLANAQQISADTSLTQEQRQAALSSLAEQMSTQVRASLGTEVGDAYLKSGGSWLDLMKRGLPITVTPDGSVRVAQPPVQRRTPPVVAAPQG
ncbi:hypothetical protein DB347_04420 [Opitutaceae bacterium EW11]|nr:hypothetical protein DB347_04420 [Opitutaceae bacterium EW11]